MIYTKTGDDGTTSLYGNQRGSKSDPVFDVLGTLDELNSCLGFLHIYKNDEIVNLVKNIQRDLLLLGSYISGYSDDLSVWSTKCLLLEENIDKYQERLEELRNFILPGGSMFSSYLNLSRAVCRRLERSLVKYHSNKEYLTYVNRLSDLLFVLARYINKLEEMPDSIWKGSLEV